MPETMEISAAAKSGDGTTQNARTPGGVGMRIHTAVWTSEGSMRKERIRLYRLLEFRFEFGSLGQGGQP